MRDEGDQPFPEILEYAAGLLLGRTSGLADTVLARVLGEIGYFHDPRRVPEDLVGSTYVATELVVSAFADPKGFTRSAEYAWQVGATRAEDGVPLGAMLHMYRIAGEELWNALVAAVVREAPERAHHMVRAATYVWRLVERETALMTEAHRQRSGDPAERSDRRMVGALKVLLRAQLDPLDLSRVSVTLGLPMDGRYAVARVTGPDAIRADGAPVREELDGVTVFWCPQPEGWAVVAACGDHLSRAVARAVGDGGRARIGVSPVVQGLAGLGRARQLADTALALCTADGELVHLKDRMAPGFLLTQRDLARELVDQVLGPVLALEPDEGQVLLETFGVWLDCSGSLPQVASRLYCHRNTVHNRLRRLERLTGRLLARPRDLVDLSMALDALRLGAAE
ncbi:helix-turn-helix domain-containing protein [Kitasatospora paranensis]|uniref:PucR family transcriptional regulator n=1 Tax=Kitasatospora paranensis TaxID=258053 RepID=A0ABW2G843_9ACTN